MRNIDGDMGYSRKPKEELPEGQDVNGQKSNKNKVRKEAHSDEEKDVSTNVAIDSRESPMPSTPKAPMETCAEDPS